MAIAERIAAGEDPESARLAAINEFGNVLQTKEDARAVWRGGVVAMVADVWQDVRFGVRMLVKNPGFSLVVIAVLHARHRRQRRDLQPVQGPRAEAAAGRARFGVDRRACSAAPSTAAASACRCRTIATSKQHDQSFEDLAGVDDDLRQPRPRQSMPAHRRRARHRQLLRDARRRRATRPHAPALGRCRAGPASGGGDRRCVVAPHRTAPIPAIVGKTLYLNGQPLTIVGVADPEFNGTVVSMGMDVFAPIMMQPVVCPARAASIAQRDVGLMTIGHLKPGVTITDSDGADARLRVAARRRASDSELRQSRRR